MKKVLALAILLAMALPAWAQYAQPTPWKPAEEKPPVIQTFKMSEQEYEAYKTYVTLFAWRDSVNKRLERLEGNKGPQGNDQSALIADLRNQIAQLNGQLQQMQNMQMMLMMKQIGTPIPLNPNPGPVIPLNPNPGPVIPLNPNPGPVIPLNPNPGPVIPIPKDPGPAIPLIPKDPGPAIPIPKINPQPIPGPGSPGPGPVGVPGYQRFTSDRPPIITGTFDRPPIITITIEKGTK